jgi:hypothetical protein
MHLGRSVAVVKREQMTAWAATEWDDGVSPAGAVSGLLAQAWRRAQALGEALAQEVSNGDGSTTALAVAEALERDRVVRFAETAHRMGVQEKRWELSDEAGARLVRFCNDLLRDLGHDPSDPDVRERVVWHLRVLADGP